MLGFDRAGDVSDGAQAGVIPCFLEQLRDQFYVSGLLNLHLATTTPVVVGSNAGLEHSRYEGRAGGRTDRSGDRGVGKAHPILAKFVQNRSFHQGFAIETIVLGLVLDHNPQDVGQWPTKKWQDECNEKKGKDFCYHGLETTLNQ